MSSSVRLSSVCLSSVTFVRPTQATEIFGIVSTPFGTLATRWQPDKSSLKSLKKCIPTLRANIGPTIRHISQTVHIYYAHTESSNPVRADSHRRAQVYVVAVVYDVIENDTSEGREVLQLPIPEFPLRHPQNSIKYKIHTHTLYLSTDFIFIHFIFITSLS